MRGRLLVLLWRQAQLFARRLYNGCLEVVCVVACCHGDRCHSEDASRSLCLSRVTMVTDFEKIGMKAKYAALLRISASVLTPSVGMACHACDRELAGGTCEV